MGKKISGSSISMNHEINMAGSEVLVRCTERKTYPPLTEPTPDLSEGFAAMLPSLMGAVPALSGSPQAGSGLAMAALGSVCASSGINISPNPAGPGFQTAYANVLQRVMNGAYASNGTLSQEELKKLIVNLVSKMMKAAGPAYTAWEQIFMEALQNGALNDFMKGGRSETCPFPGDPVNANTGNFIYEKEDLRVNGKMPLLFKRFYNGRDARSGSMGRGWYHNYEIRMLMEEDHYVIIWDDGREEIYLRGKEGRPEPLFGGICCLKRNKNEFLYETKDKTVYKFSLEGSLLRKEEPNGQRLIFQYDSCSRLSFVTNENGSFLNYKYDHMTGLLAEVKDHTERKVTLIYELGQLKEVKNPMGFSYLYSYGANEVVYRIRNSKGICVLENNYDNKGRVIKQAFADGGNMTFDYQEDLSRTMMTEQNGNKIAYVHDDRFRNIKTIYVDGQETFSYNDRNQMVVKTDKKGNTIRFSYDDRGNTTQIIYPDGMKRNMTYDAGNRLLTLTINGVMKLKNIYDTKGNLIKTSDALDRCREIEYDSRGNAVKVIMPDGGISLLSYDSRGNITSITDEMENTVSYEYDNCNRVISVIDGNKHRTRFSYNDCNLITSMTNADGKSRFYEYTKNGKLLKIKDFNGAVTSQEYNNMNQVKSITQPDRGTVFLEYDLMQNVSKRNFPNGAQVSYEYNSLNHLERMTLPTGGSISYEYDPNGNRVAEIDPNGTRISFEYDERNRRTAVIDGSGARTEFDYDMDGNLITITNPEGKSYTFSYDEAGQKISEIDILGNRKKYEYSQIGKISSITTPKGKKILYEYYPGGALKKQIFPNGNHEEYFYDNNKNLVRRRNQKGDYLLYSYDSLDQLVKIKSSFGQEMSYCYDAVGNIISMKDALGHITKYEYSPGNHLTAVIDASGNKTEYAYDSMGSLIAICQHGGCCDVMGDQELMSTGHLTKYERDTMGKIVGIKDPLGEQEHYQYNLAGQLISKEDKEGFKTQYTYTLTGDLKEVNYADGRSVEFTYNSLRKLTEIKDWLGTTEVLRDEAGRPVKITDFKGRKVSYEWGKTGERKALIYPDGKEVRYEYDEFSRLCRLIDGEDEILYKYNKEGFLKEKVFPNSLTSSYIYDDMGRLSSLIHKEDDKLLEQFDYKYDLVGNKTEIIKKRQMLPDNDAICQEYYNEIKKVNGVYKYQYDNNNRLTGVYKDKDRLRKFEYDAFGNRVKKREGNSDTYYYYNAMNQLLETGGAGGAERYQYDKRGNISQIIKNGEISNTYRYDETNRMVEACNIKGQRATYTYNGIGNRVGKAENIGSNVKYSCFLLDLTKDTNNLLQVADEKVQTFVWDGQVVSLNTNQKHTSYYLYDEMDSPIRLQTKEKQTVGLYVYDEFGNDLSTTQKIEQPFGYTGYQHDKVSNTYFAQHREYISDKGRFAEADPVTGFIHNPKTLNPYGYCFGNPMNLIDVNGKFPLPPTESTYMPSQEDRSMPSNARRQPGYEFKYTMDDYNEPYYCERTNCYAYAFDLIDNPISGKDFYSENEDLDFALQPGMLSGLYYERQYRYDFTNELLPGTEESNKELINVITADAQALGMSFRPYEEGMMGGYRVALAIDPNRDYHWYRDNQDGTWSHKPGDGPVTNYILKEGKGGNEYIYGKKPITDPEWAAKQYTTYENADPKNYPVFLGYFYISRCSNAE